MKFLDEAKIHIQSGAGGDGCVAFRRERNIPFGGPNGGNGGRGGDVWFECASGLNTLIDFRYQQHFKAKKGMHGMGSLRSGHDGDDLTIRVPAGTQIFDEHGEELIADLTQVGQRLCLAKGGKGGMGNAHFKSSTNQAPRQFTKGGEAEEHWFWLRLKLLSDAGLLGLPNAGKSTFLAAVTRAKPKIADYPFTTLVPNLGVVRFRDELTFVVADIPGLIEGAHEGAGLGTQFLRHIERCRLLVHLIDAGPTSGKDIVDAYKEIRRELEMYDKEKAGEEGFEPLSPRPELVVLNKIDSADEGTVRAAMGHFKKKDLRVFAISAATGKGTKELVDELGKRVFSDK